MEDEEAGVAVSDGHGVLPIVPESPDQVDMCDGDQRNQRDGRAAVRAPGGKYQIRRQPDITQKSQKKSEVFERQGEVVFDNGEAGRGYPDLWRAGWFSAQKP